MNHNTSRLDNEEGDGENAGTVVQSCCSASCPHSLAASCPPSPASAANVNTKTLGMYVVGITLLCHHSIVERYIA